MTTALQSQIEWEARRVAAAFGVEEIEDCGLSVDRHYFSANGCWFCAFDSKTGALIKVDLSTTVEEDFRYLQLQRYEGKFILIGTPNHPFAELMARGLYRLGFTDESVLSQLPPLSAHEQIELRLTMPREFWPQKWLEEVSET